MPREEWRGPEPALPSFALHCAVGVLRLAFLLWPLCWGEDSPAQEKSEASATFSQVKRISEWTTFFQNTERSQSLLNPANRVRSVPRFLLQSYLKEDFRWIINESTQVVVRPFFLIERKEFEQGPFATSMSETFIKDRTQFSTTDAYWEQKWNEKFITTLGIQKYQWGPGELNSPSNPFFHFNSQSQSFFNLVKGRFLFRAAQSLSDAKSSVNILVEPISYDLEYWIADKAFQPVELVKWDWQFSNPSNYFSLIMGQMEDHISFGGGYCNFSPWEGWSLYLDSRIAKGNRAYYPLGDGTNGLHMKEDSDRANNIETLSLLGIRLETENWDARMEYLYNSLGLNKDQQDLAVLSASPSNSFATENMRRLGASGREVLGRHYVYASLRIPQVRLGWGKKEKNLAFRYLHSLQDQSGSAQGAVDGPLTANWVWNVQLQLSRGPLDSELKNFENSSIVFGVTGFW